MEKIYPAIFHPYEEGFWVEFPDLEGCVTEGNTLPETMANASEVLGAYLASLNRRGITPEMPGDIRDQKLSGDDFATYITASETALKNTKAVKKTLSIPAWMNEAAEARHLNFSKVLQDALAAILD